MSSMMLKVASVLGFCASMATAAVITQTVQIPDHVPAGSSELVYNKFDASLGTLTAVQVIFNQSVYGGWLGVDNDSDKPGTATATIGTTGSLSHKAGQTVRLFDGDDLNVWQNLRTTLTESFDLAADDGDGPGFQMGGDDYGEMSGPEKSSALLKTSDAFIGSDWIGRYEGDGTYTLVYTSDQVVSVSGTGVAYSGMPTSAFGSVTVNYYYTPVPEPATAAMAGLGVLMLLRRRRRGK